MQGDRIDGVDWPNRIAKYNGIPVRTDDFAAYGIWTAGTGFPELESQYVSAGSRTPVEESPLQEQYASATSAPQDTGERPELQQATGAIEANKEPEQSFEHSDPFRTTQIPTTDAEAAEPSATFVENEIESASYAHPTDISGSATGLIASSTGAEHQFVTDERPSASAPTDFLSIAGHGSASCAPASGNCGFQPFSSPWIQPVGDDAGELPRPNLTIVEGDYYDVQIGYSFGQFNDELPLDSTGYFSLASVLHSPASSYDLVVIEQDLVEINVIVQLNIGVLGTTVPDPNIQSNLAVIAEYGDQSGFQVTLGGSFHTSLIKQFNYVASVNSANQTNNAAILGGTARDTTSNGLPVVPGGVGSYGGDLISAISADPDLSILYVTGTYYEINAIYQLSWVTQQTGGMTQSDTALISDFDGVASHQLVRGDEFDISIISQINYLSQADQQVPFMSSEVFPTDGIVPGLIETTMIPLQGIVAHTGDMTIDLMAV